MRGVKAPSYLFAAELVDLVRKRGDALTLVFDQSVRRGVEHIDMEKKLRHLQHHEVFSFAYISHACFIVVGLDYSLIDRAFDQLIGDSRLPDERLLRITDS
jgi:hypothetical protein